jgi:hypothetical protein
VRRTLHPETRLLPANAAPVRQAVRAEAGVLSWHEAVRKPLHSAQRLLSGTGQQAVWETLHPG